MVLWLIGISGAGKTTLAELLKSHLEKKKQFVFMLDGDRIREFYDNDLGYSIRERRENIKRIILAAHVLDECNVFCVIANISPFDDLRIFARRKIKNYNQIYLKKDITKSIDADVKGIYSSNMGGGDIVGKDIVFEEPTNSELIIDVDKMNATESLQIILNYIKHKYGV